MKRLIITMSVISLFLLDCNNPSTEKSNKHLETINSEEHQHDTETEDIELNNGEKWMVDANMMVHIQDMAKDINSFEGKSMAEYTLLSKKLEESIDLLTSNCTMEGKAHDELHKWLVPYIDLVSDLSKAKIVAEAIDRFENIKTSFKTFDQYFQ